MAHHSCLTSDQLLALWNDELPAEEETFWTEHLTHCPVCTELAESLSDDPSFREFFQRYARPPEPLPKWVKELTRTVETLSLAAAAQFSAALARLEQEDASAADLVKLRVSSGLSVEEAAAVLGVPLSSAKRDWAFAQAWLFRELKPPGQSEG